MGVHLCRPGRFLPKSSFAARKSSQSAATTRRRRVSQVAPSGPGARAVQPYWRKGGSVLGAVLRCPMSKSLEDRDWLAFEDGLLPLTPWNLLRAGLDGKRLDQYRIVVDFF